MSSNAGAGRRGRPKNPNARSASERAAAARAKRLTEGNTVRQFMLSPEATAALAAIRARDGDKSDTATIERVLIEAAKR